MKIRDLKEITKAPLKGHVLAYFRQGILFEEYQDRDVLSGRLEEREQNGDEILELHLFDSQKEYRCISTRSKRYPDGFIEHVAEFKDDEELSVFKEQVSLEKGKGMLRVLNYIEYREDNGMAMVTDYRLTV